MAASFAFLSCGQIFLRSRLITLKPLVSSWYAVATIPKITGSERYLILLWQSLGIFGVEYMCLSL